jgi:DmsE family decaheme c-type cytochrome
LRYLVLLVALICTWSQAQTLTSTKPPNVEHSDFAGSELCAPCHQEIYKNFEKTPHWKTTFDKRRNVAARGEGCESCHGPGRAHIEGQGDPTKIFGFKKVGTAKIVERCLECHQYGEEHSNFLRSAHKTSDLSCLDCHSAHHFAEKQFLLRKAQPELCYSCHQETIAEFARPFRHRVDEKLVRCTDCHNQHGGLPPAQLRSTTAQDSICVKCHVEKSGPFVFEHAPLRTEGCASCHVPHGSQNPRLLTRGQVNLLCLECHTISFGSMTRDPAAFHDQSAQFQACTLCHTTIHGSNFSRIFLR